MQCGEGIAHPDRRGLYQFNSPDGEFLDMNSHHFQLIDENQLDLDESTYRLTSKGCLLLFGKSKVHLQIPGTGFYIENLDSTDGLRILTLRIDETLPSIHFLEEREVYGGNASLSVIVESNVRTKFCIEPQGQSICNPGNELGVPFSSEKFIATQNQTIPLPNVEGSYLLYILAQNRPGNLRMFTKPIIIDLSAPHVAADFIESVRHISYNDKLHYYLPSNYRLSFYSNSDSLASLEITYCLKRSDDRSNSCSSDEKKVYSYADSIILDKGSWRLLYQAKDPAGNLTRGGWAQARILVQVQCSMDLFTEVPLTYSERECTELIGSIDLKTLPSEYWRFLDQLIHVDGGIFFSYDEAIERPSMLPKFRNLRSVTEIGIWRFPTLTEFNAFPQLVEADRIYFVDNTDLITIKGFNQLKTLRELEITRNHSLKDLDAMQQLEIIEQDCQIGFNDQLVSLDFLHNLQRAGDMRLENNKMLSDLRGLRSLQSVHSLTIQHNPSLVTLDGLRNLQYAYEFFFIASAVKNLSGLDKLREVHAAFYIQGHPALHRLKGLENLVRVGTLGISGNPSLKSVSHLIQLQVVNNIWLQYNASIQTISGLSNLQLVQDQLVIAGNDKLNDIVGFSQLKTIHYASIDRNPELLSIHGFQNLKQIEINFRIVLNDSLVDIRGFDCLDDPEVALYINYNDSWEGPLILSDPSAC